MRVRGLAFVGLVVGAFLIPSATAVNSPLTSQSHSSSSSSQLDRFFSSDGPESLHESYNQGTVDQPWPKANSWLHATLTDSEREFLSLAVTGSPTTATPTSLPSTATPTTSAPATATPTTTASGAGYCQSNPTACLNGGTCTNGASNSYSCTCASGYIGNSCEYNIFGSSKRNRLAGGSQVGRGRSITRPNVHVIKPIA